MEGDTYMCPPGKHETMANTVTKELNKYLQQPAQKRKSEANYFEDTNKQSSLLPQKLEVFHHQDVEVSKPNEEKSKTLLESLEEDTSHFVQNNANQIDDNLPIQWGARSKW